MKKKLYILVILIANIYSPNSLMSQLDSLGENQFLAFPNWQKGDKKLITSSTTEIKIINGDSIVSNSLDKNILTVLEKSDKYYYMLLQDLNFDSSKYQELFSYVENEIDTQNFEMILEKALSNTMAHLLDKISTSKGIEFKIDKWGYYKGLNEVINIDSLKTQLSNEFQNIKELNHLSKEEITELIEFFDLKEIEQIFSNSFFEDSRSFYEPYDLRLSKEKPLIDTIFFSIPWFTNPVSCQKKVSMQESIEEIEIEISYKYLIDQQSYLPENNLKSLNNFSLRLKSNYVLDYNSKWIKHIYSETIREENENKFIEKSEFTIKTAM